MILCCPSKTLLLILKQAFSLPLKVLTEVLDGNNVYIRYKAFLYKPYKIFGM